MAFLVDSSGSIGRRNWGKMTQFLKDMVKAFNVGPDKTHIAIVAYSSNAVLEFKFDRLKGSQVTEAGYNRLIDGIRFQRGFTFIDKALMLADEQVFQISAGMRPELPQVRKQRESLKICRPLCYSLLIEFIFVKIRFRHYHVIAQLWEGVEEPEGEKKREGTNLFVIELRFNFRRTSLRYGLIKLVSICFDYSFSRQKAKQYTVVNLTANLPSSNQNYR